MAANSLSRSGPRSKPRGYQAQLNEVLKGLHQIQSAVVVAVAALRQQNCELDADISNVLQRSVADRLQDQIETLEVLSEPRARSKSAMPGRQ
jgi:hypothetical protein